MPILARILAFCIVPLLMLASCSSSTVIDTRPPGARLYVDGGYVGKTPYTYSDRKIAMSTTHLQFSMDGYNDLFAMIRRDEEVNVPAALGFFLLVPCLWIAEYKSYHTYDLKRISAADSAARAQNDAPPPTSIALEQKLNEFKKMLNDSAINQAEYERLRQRAIDNAK